MAASKWAFAMAFCVAVVVSATVDSILCDDKTVLDLHSDAYQFPNLGHEWMESSYHEWWFFTFYDPVQQLGAAFGIGVSDPHDPANGTISWTGMLFNPGTGAIPVNYYGAKTPVSTLQATTDNATLSTPSASIEVLEEGHYAVNIWTPDQSFSISLDYLQHVPPAKQVENFSPIGLLAWESYMPSATVEGSVTLDGTVIPIGNGNQVRGYHDKNWGAWPSSKFNWIWSQYSDPDQELGIVWGAYDLLGKYVGYMFLRVNGEKLKLGTTCLNSFELTPLEMQVDPVTGYSYASKQHIVVSSGTWKVDGTLEVLPNQVGNNPGSKGLGLLVFEMISKYDYKVYKNNQLLMESTGFGFNEWSDLKHN